jgi:hypothetical protein
LSLRGFGLGVLTGFGVDVGLSTVELGVSGFENCFLLVCVRVHHLRTLNSKAITSAAKALQVVVRNQPVASVWQLGFLEAETEKSPLRHLEPRKIQEKKFEKNISGKIFHKKTKNKISDPISP